jgi:hypothetical protein
MYFQDELDGTTSIADGVTHAGFILDFSEFFGFYIHLEATAIPQGTIYEIQVSGRAEKPTLDSHWETIDTDTFVNTSRPTIVENDSNMKWIRYRVINGGGSAIENFYGVIAGKGNR